MIVMMTTQMNHIYPRIPPRSPVPQINENTPTRIKATQTQKKRQRSDLGKQETRDGDSKQRESIRPMRTLDNFLEGIDEEETVRSR